MKEKFKKFIFEKKELLIFIGVVVFVFAAVIAVAGIALSDTNTSEVISNLPDDNDITDDEPSISDDTNTDNEPVVTEDITFGLPISGEYVIVRSYFDVSLSDEDLETAIISNGQSLETSKGISYAKADDSVFDVLSIYDGIVVDIATDDLAGTTVTIKHSEEVSSIYYSLSDVIVSVGDSVIKGEKIASASTSIDDTLASVHVHLEIEVNNNKINPATIIGKTLDDIVDEK